MGGACALRAAALPVIGRIRRARMSPRLADQLEFAMTASELRDEPASDPSY
jgi:hypothetical protein